MNNIKSYTGCPTIVGTTALSHRGGWVKSCDNISIYAVSGKRTDGYARHTENQAYCAADPKITRQHRNTKHSEAKSSAQLSCTYTSGIQDRHSTLKIYSITNNLIFMKRNLLKTLLVAVGLAMGVTNMSAALKTVWSIDFTEIGKKYSDKTGITILTDNTINVGNTVLGTCKANEDVLDTKFLLQTGTNWLLRKSNGLYQSNGGDRAFGLSDCKKGQKITIEATGAPTIGSNLTEESSGNTSVFTVQEDGAVKFNFPRYLYIKRIIVEENEISEDAKPTTYTIKFVDQSNNTIKEDIQIESHTGEEVSASESMLNSFNTDDKKYIYVSGNNTITLVEDTEQNIITLIFREAATWNYTVNTVVAGNTNKIAEGSDFEEEIAYVNYPRYYNIDGILYSHEAKGNNGYYSHSFTIKSNNQIENINGYQAVKENIVYYNEAESINGLTMSSAANSDIRCSNGKCAYNANEEAVAIVTLPAGKYRLYTSIWGSAGTEFIFKANDVKIESSYICSDKDPGTSGLFASKGYIQDYESKEFTLSTETAITLETTTDGSRGIDFIYIQRTGDATETVSVTDAGMATYCPAVALDFTGATKIAAYKASVSGNTVTLTKVSTVAAGEGVLLRALNDAATTEDIVIAAEAESNAGNDFTGVQAETTLNETDGEYTNYVLSKEGETVGFFKARPEADGGTKLAAGKAYLKVLTTNAAKGIKVIFDGETTGIGTIKDNTAKDNAIYNLNGQRVASPEKGLYIMNGKKIIVK